MTEFVAFELTGFAGELMNEFHDELKNMPFGSILSRVKAAAERQPPRIKCRGVDSTGEVDYALILRSIVFATNPPAALMAYVQQERDAAVEGHAA